MDADLQKQLEEIKDSVDGVAKKIGGNFSSFIKGLLRGLGTVIGAALAVLLIGWFLNAIGVIPALRDQANQWKAIFQQAQPKPTPEIRK